MQTVGERKATDLSASGAGGSGRRRGSMQPCAPIEGSGSHAFPLTEPVQKPLVSAAELCRTAQASLRTIDCWLKEHVKENKTEFLSAFRCAEASMSFPAGSGMHQFSDDRMMGHGSQYRNSRHATSSTEPHTQDELFLVLRMLPVWPDDGSCLGSPKTG